MTEPGTGIERRPANVLASADVMGEAQFDNAFRMAKALAASHMFKDVTTAEQAFGRMLIGADLGLSPTQALMTIDVVKGNVQIRGKQLLAWVKASESYDYKIVERSPESGTIRFFEKSKRTGEWEACEPDITFTAAEAKKAGIAGNPGWVNYPANMCLWRCASIGVNLHCPDLTGGIPVYTEADSFESTAVELTAGEGDGSEPGWQGLSEGHVEQLESLLRRAALLNFPGLTDRATAQMRLNGQPAEVVQAYIDDAEAQLAAVQPPVGEIVEPEEKAS